MCSQTIAVVMIVKALFGHSLAITEACQVELGTKLLSECCELLIDCRRVKLPVRCCHGGFDKHYLNLFLLASLQDAAKAGDRFAANLVLLEMRFNLT